MTTEQLQVVSSDLFGLHAGTFVAEMSDLSAWTVSKLLPGFIMVSSSTGKQLVFRLQHTEWRAGELLYWDFVSEMSDTDPIVARVYND